MAEIRESLTLEDRFSGPLKNFIQKMETAVQKNQEFYQSEARMAGETGRLVQALSGFESAIHGAFTDVEMDAALTRLQREMRRTGLVWTNEADQMEASDLIVRVGLRQLAQEGRLAASAMVENATAADRAAQAQQRHEARLKSVRTALGRFVSSLLGANRAAKTYDGLDKQFRRFALTMFSVSRIFNFLKSSLERAPQSIQNSWNAAGTSISNLFGGVVVAALQGLQPHIDRLNEALNSESGQKLARGLETMANVGGQALGFLLDKVSQLVEFIGNNFQTVMTVAAVVVGVFAAQMLVAAASMVAANLPLILFVGLIASVVTGLMAAGVTSQEIFAGIGSAAGWLYAFVYNLVADLWNQFAVFAEFFANVFNDPVAAVAHLFFDTFDNILGVVETVAGAIDALLGSEMADAVSGFRSDMQNWVDDTFGENEIKVDRMEKLSYENVMADFAEAGAGLANSLSDFSLTNALAAPLSPKLDDISKSVKGIEKSVAMSDEDIKALVDVAERRYVNQVNLTSQTPVITVNGANTGRTAQDRRALADAIEQILREEWASGSVRSTAYV